VDGVVEAVMQPLCQLLAVAAAVYLMVAMQHRLIPLAPVEVALLALGNHLLTLTKVA
jgi:hypothetical protein